MDEAQSRLCLVKVVSWERLYRSIGNGEAIEIADKRIHCGTSLIQSVWCVILVEIRIPRSAGGPALCLASHSWIFQPRFSLSAGRHELTLPRICSTHMNCSQSMLGLLDIKSRFMRSFGNLQIIMRISTASSLPASKTLYLDSKPAARIELDASERLGYPGAT